MKDFDENRVLETPRLILRFPEERDAEALFRNINHDKEVLRYYVDRYAETKEEYDIGRMIDAFRNRQMYIFVIELKGSGEVIGLIHQCSNPSDVMNTVEVGYAIGRRHWNKGYVSEALKAVIGFLFNEGIHKVTACHFVENTASGRVMEKCGMTFEGKSIDELYYHDEYHDTMHYCILNGRR